MTVRIGLEHIRAPGHDPTMTDPQTPFERPGYQASVDRDAGWGFMVPAGTTPSAAPGLTETLDTMDLAAEAGADPPVAIRTADRPLPTMRCSVDLDDGLLIQRHRPGTLFRQGRQIMHGFRKATA